MDYIRPFGRDENTRSVSEQMTAILESAGKKYGRCSLSSNSRSKSSSRVSRGDDEVSRQHVYKIAEALLQDAMEKLDDRIIDLAQKTVIDALETCDVDHNETFIKEALCSALNSLLPSILEDDSGIRELFKSAIVQVSTSEKG